MTPSTQGAEPDPAFRPREVPVFSRSPQSLAGALGDVAIADAQRNATQLLERLQSRVIWHINSTERGGGVAEMLQSLLPYARGMGIDSRWLVIGAGEEFFRITKRIHHALHGSPGDGSALDDSARQVYEAVLQQNADDLLTIVRAGDIVVLHDPQTAGLIGTLKQHGAKIVWRCHVGSDDQGDPNVQEGWDFLAPYLLESDVNVFSHPSYIPECCDDGRSLVIHPSIDPLSPKNQDMNEATVRAILIQTGIISDGMREVLPGFHRIDGSPGRVDRMADITGLGPPPRWDEPLIVQVSRWDPLKDPIGVIDGFVEYLHVADSMPAHLLLAGPTVKSIPDDPEGAETLDRVIAHWRALTHSARSKIRLACLPMADAEENAAIVNAIQRHAAIVVQKSIREGFGLTVTEAMWKGRPMIASAVGGIVDQVEDGVTGLLLSDPSDRRAFAAAVRRILGDPELARTLGEAGRESVRRDFLPIRHLLDWAAVFERLLTEI
jgi:trehalose synthase